jgi:hypothetical protein
MNPIPALQGLPSTEKQRSPHTVTRRSFDSVHLSGHDRGGMNRAGKNTDCRRKHQRVCMQRLRMGLADTELFYRKFAERSHASGVRRA